MENTEQKQSLVDLAEASGLLKRSQSIIYKCDSTVASYAATSSQSFAFKTGSKLPSYVFDPLQPNPQEKEQVDKCVERIKSTLKRPEKASTIRKSELGENQLVFSNEETMKLEIIDELLQKGLPLPSEPFALQLKPQLEMEEVDIEKCIKINSHPNPFEEELQNFQEWRQFGNKQAVVEMVDSFAKNYIDSMELPKDKVSRKKKQAKLLSFVNKPRNTTSDMQLPKNRISIKTAQSKVSGFPKPGGKSEPMRQSFMGNEALGHETLDLNKKANHRLNSTLFRKMEGKREELLKLTTHFCRVGSSTYMTPQRIQALYECKMIKTAKKLMSNREYINLRITVGSPFSLEEKRSEPAFYETHNFTKRAEKERLATRNQMEIDKILEKNKNRIKLEKQRVIEKLRC